MKAKNSVYLYMLIIITIILVVLTFETNTSGRENVKMSYSQLLEKIEQGEILSVTMQRDSKIDDYGKAIVVTNDNKEVKIVLPSFSSSTKAIEEAAKNTATDLMTAEIPNTGALFSILPYFLMTAVTILVFVYFFQKIQGNNAKAMTFGKSRAKLSSESKTKFSDVAGLKEEKDELKEIVDFLKSPKKFRDLGARIPKGVLLVGVPGTGKTLLAKAVSGEAGVPFFSISGSDFVELYVGIGASRVRDLFEQAKKSAPAIIFIDEIDAVGRHRGSGLGGGHDEREQTLNQLLVEMDGFSINEGVIVLAATNRVDILDPAILRAGRFDRMVTVDLPDVEGREEILHVHSKDKPLAKDVDLKVIAQTTSGFTGADLENLLNEAALLAAKENKKALDMEDLRRAFIKVGVGTEKRSKIVSDEDKRKIACHEAGHALAYELQNELDSVHSISIIPTGRAAGYVIPIPGQDKMMHSKSFMLQSIVALLAGRAAEQVVNKEITSGASNDIERSTKIARNMVKKYGMSDSLGPILYGDDSDEVFIGRDMHQNKGYSEKIAAEIDSEIRIIIDNAYETAIDLISENRGLLDGTVEFLLKHEKMTGQEFRSLVKEHTGVEHVINELEDTVQIVPEGIDA